MVSDLRRLAFVAALLLPSLAWARDPTAADRETARTYMADGRKKRDENDLKSALRAFEAADAIMHVPTTGLEVARTQAMLGLLVEARDGALRVVRSPQASNEPAPFVEARTAAKKLAEDLETRIPSVRVVLKNAPPNAAVTIDGSPMPAIAIGLPRKLDPGGHVVVARAGSTERTMNVQVFEREAKDVTIDLNAPAAPAAVEPPREAHATAPPPAPEPVATAHRPPWTAVGVAFLGVGGAGVVLGAIAGSISLAQTSSIRSQCTVNVCPTKLSDGSDTTSALATANALATLSDVAFIAGGVLAAAGVVFVVIGGSHGAKSSMALHVGPGSFMLSGSF